MEVIVVVDTENLQRRLIDGVETARNKLRIVMDRLSISVQSAVKDTKLSGQVLNVRTGTLRRSINRKTEETEISVKAIVGTNVSYAAIHEYGFVGVENVRAHIRRIREASRIDKKGNVVKGKLTGGVCEVKAHTRNVKMPERSFLRSTLKEFEPTIRNDIRNAVLSVLAK